jgi:hypothetical protein
MADQSSTRHRFQFRLRTLLIVVTLLCVVGGYVGRQVRIIRERTAELEKLRNRNWPHDLFGAFTMSDFYRLNFDPSTTPEFFWLKPELLASRDPNQTPSVVRGLLGDINVRAILLPKLRQQNGCGALGDTLS